MRRLCMMQYSLTAAQIQNNHPVKPLELHEGSPALSVKAAEDVCVKQYNKCTLGGATGHDEAVICSRPANQNLYSLKQRRMLCPSSGFTPVHSSVAYKTHSFRNASTSCSAVEGSSQIRFSDMQTVKILI